MDLTPYRILVFGTENKITGKGRKRHTKAQGFGYVLWNSIDGEAGRLLGSGSFVWRGLHTAYHAARMAFVDDRIEQVSIRTDQDREVYRMYRQLRQEETPLFRDVA
jgi:hypothetical protein